MVFIPFALGLVFFFSGCAILTPQETNQWNYLVTHGIVTEPEHFKSATAAAFINLIPGLAELVYLDLEDHTGGVMQLACCWFMPIAMPLLWFVSIPCAIYDTDTSNLELTIKAHLDEIPKKLGGYAPDSDEAAGGGQTGRAGREENQE